LVTLEDARLKKTIRRLKLTTRVSVVAIFFKQFPVRNVQTLYSASTVAAWKQAVLRKRRVEKRPRLRFLKIVDSVLTFDTRCNGLGLISQSHF
jgi:hypothetical protein